VWKDLVPLLHVDPNLFEVKTALCFTLGCKVNKFVVWIPCVRASMVENQMFTWEAVLETLKDSAKEPVCLIRGVYSNVAKGLFAA